MEFLVVTRLLWTAVLGLLAATAVSDLRRRIIPNELVITIAVAGIAIAALARPSTLLIGVLAAFVLLVGMLTLTHYRLVGGGDAKLIAAVSLLVPPEEIGALLIVIAVAGGLLSAVYLATHIAVRRFHALRHRPRLTGWSRGLRAFLRGEHARIVSGRSVPYGIAISGAVIVHVVSELYQCSSGISCLV